MAASRIPAQEIVGETAPAPLAQVKRRILVAEADRIDQRVLHRLLDLLGHEVESAASGRDALVRWRQGGIELLMVDAALPDMPASELARTLRLVESARRLVRTPVVVLCQPAAGAAPRLSADIDAALDKPVQIRALQDVLARCVVPGAKPAAANAARPGEPPVVDLNVLHGLVGNDPDVVREFLADYLASAREQARDLHRAYRQGDVRLVGALAHKLRSASRAVGALALAELCAEMELPAASDFGTAELEHARFERVFEAAIAQIENHLRRMPR